MCITASTSATRAQMWPSIHGPDSTPHYPAVGSTYVPLDSWVYTALEKLAGERYIVSEFRGVKPWTRTECARQTDEAGQRIEAAIQADQNVPDFIVSTYDALTAEFAPELAVLGGEHNRSLQMESVYARVMSMSGPSLDDSYHFGQTIWNDYGRPDRRGTDAIVGGAARATWGPFFAYVDQEFQHAPSEPNYSPSVQNAVLQMDLGQAFLPHGGPAIDQLQSLDTYVGVNLKNWQFSYGRQSLWWGTGESGGLLMTDNAEPINVLQINRVVPFRLPSIFNLMGPIRIDFMVGKLGGHQDISLPSFCPPGVATCGAAPWIQNTRISFKPTEHFEIGISHAAIFGGSGFQNGAAVFIKAFIPIDRLIQQSNSQFQNKQFMSFDFLYRFNHRFTMYTEYLGSDDPDPFSQISRDAINTGVFFPKLPWLSDKFDLRFEGVYTSSPLNTAIKPNDGILHYWSTHWQGGYTNDGFIFGNAIGRDARRYQGWLTYHLSPKNELQLNVAHTQESPNFIPGGGDWTDYRVNFVQNLRSGFYFSGFVQAEHLNYPILFSGTVNNVTASVEVGYIFRSHLF
jgi:hypothetical protein